MNGDANTAFAQAANANRRLTMPVLFLHAAFDYVCETIDSQLPTPMRASCSNHTETTIPSGHWMAQEKPVEVNSALARWLATQFPLRWA